MSLDTTRHEKAIEGIVRIPAIVTLGLIGLSGCVSLPALEPASSEMTQQEVSGHVEFLSQYALQGRTPRSRGSAAARRYIARQFRACGLVPWGQAKGYTQSFLLGTNVIGVLPGSDPNLAKEVVILSAHYDHLGWTRRGLCLGACDNASGVAVMLEIAEQLASSPQRPRRSVCFAAFDQEENFSFGALALTCCQDYDPNRIAAVLNLDMLGRHGFEVLDRHLFVVGTEAYPDLRRQIRGLAEDRIEILPVGTDIVGPRGDHVVFESLGVPALFFTCSLYKDYHKPGDTADKLDYDVLLQSAQLVYDTVRLLANNPGRYTPIPPSHGDIEEVEALHLCLGRVMEHPEGMDLTSQERQSIKGLVEKTGQILQENDYSLEDRHRFLWWHAVETLVPLMERFVAPPASLKAKPPDEKTLAIQRRGWCFISMEGRRAMVETGQALIRHISRYRHPLLMGMPPFQYTTSFLPNAYISLTPRDDRQAALVAVYIRGTTKYTQPPVWLWPLRRPSLAGSTALWTCFASDGTRKDLIDVCLLDWGGEKDPNTCRDVWQKVLNRITEGRRDRTFQQWLDWRLAQGPWPDQKSWITDRARCGQWRVVSKALSRMWSVKAHAEIESVSCTLLADPNTNPYLRDIAIRYIHQKAGRPALLALAGMVNDPTPIPDRGVRCPDPFLSDLLNYLGATDKKPVNLPSPKQKAKTVKKAPTSLGELAQRRLEQWTGKDFGRDRDAWVRWIERHRRESPG